MAEEKKDKWVGDPIKLLLKVDLSRQRDETMNIFAQILWWLLTIEDASTSSGHFVGTTPFKVQVNFDIPVFEGNIDADILEKWVNLLEGYFSVYNFSDREKITFTLLKVVTHISLELENFYYKDMPKIEFFGYFGILDSLYNSKFNEICVLSPMSKIGGRCTLRKPPQRNLKC
jgi:hypothetical protein